MRALTPHDLITSQSSTPNDNITLRVKFQQTNLGGHIQSIAFYPWPPKMHTFLHSKYIHCIPRAPKVSTGSNMNFKL